MDNEAKKALESVVNAAPKEALDARGNWDGDRFVTVIDIQKVSTKDANEYISELRGKLKASYT